ncbi:hypothetical protein ATDW_26080 [Asticcacaulis sp. DW145]|uniref:hypothetical protein n=1 Tax=Asticcacaulis sp. DW145 TaxID=3095608 RepID=UPI0030939AE2|nr:hypothetical protein ATDW_26080 [Asticcacaulis sp. DW145]
MKRTLCLILSMIAIASPSAASMTGFGTINTIIYMKNGAILFNTSAERTTPTPACQSATFPKRFAIDASTVSGQAYASGLITAYAMGKKVRITGTGTCDIFWDTETVQYFEVEN